MSAFNKIVRILLIFAMCISLVLATPIVAATDYNGYWRLIEIQVEESEYFNPAPSNYRVRAIEFKEGELDVLNVGEMVVVNDVTTEELDGSAGIYQSYYKWMHPQTLLKVGQKYQFKLNAEQLNSTTSLMLGNSITCGHQLLSPPGLYQPSIPTINNASLMLMNKEYGESGLTAERIFEFSPRVPDAKREYGYIFRINLVSGNAYRRYDYIYEWVSGPYPSVEEIRVFINNQILVPEVPPMIVDNRTLLPLRAILESLGAEVGWEGTSKKITATKGDVELILHVGSKEAILNGQVIMMDVTPLIVNNRTLVPARFLAESFGSMVEWDGVNRIVTITYE